MICKKCGNNLPDNSKDCPNCGNVIVESVKTGSKFRYLFIINNIAFVIVSIINGLIFFDVTDTIKHFYDYAYLFGLLLVIPIAAFISVLLSILCKHKKSLIFSNITRAIILITSFMAIILSLLINDKIIYGGVAAFVIAIISIFTSFYYKKHSLMSEVSLGLTIRRIISYIVLVILTFLCLFSFYILIVNCTRSHAQIQRGFSFMPGKYLVRNYKNLMANDTLPVFKGIFNSFFIAACTALLTTYFSALTAYAIHAYNFKAKKAMFTFILMIMMVPTQVTALGFIKLVRQMDLMNNFIPLIVPSIAAPIVFFFIKQYMDSSLPIEIVEAARIDGAHEFKTFNKIVMPIMKPAIAVQMIFAFTTSWNNYFIPALILNKKDVKTLPIIIAQLRSADFMKFDYGQVYMLIGISIFPVVVVYLLLSKNIVRGVAIGSVKG